MSKLAKNLQFFKNIKKLKKNFMTQNNTFLKLIKITLLNNHRNILGLISRVLRNPLIKKSNLTTRKNIKFNTFF